MNYNIITVTLNPAIDVTLWIDKLDSHEPVKSTKEKSYAGGKAINISRVLASIGVKSKVVGIAGRDNFLALEKLLKKSGVQYEFINAEGSIRENVTICLPNGELFKINRKGIEIPESSLESIRNLIQKNIIADKKNIIAFSGGIPPNMTENMYKQLILCFSQDKNNLISIDSDIFSYQSISEIKPFIIKPNLVEFEKLVGASDLTEQDIISHLAKLSKVCDNVLISMSGDGGFFAHKNDLYKLDVPKVAVKSTVGAGDTTLACFIAAYIKGESVQNCIKYALAAGVASVTLDGTEAVNQCQIDSFIQKINITAYKTLL